MTASQDMRPSSQIRATHPPARGRSVSSTLKRRFGPARVELIHAVYPGSPPHRAAVGRAGQHHVRCAIPGQVIQVDAAIGPPRSSSSLPFFLTLHWRRSWTIRAPIPARVMPMIPCQVSRSPRNSQARTAIWTSIVLLMMLDSVALSACSV